MKFTAFKDYKGAASIVGMLNYLSSDLAAALRELRTGLSRLTFSDNFESYELVLTIQSGEEQTIPNPFRSGVIPSKWILVRTDEPGLSVCDGVKAWTVDSLYLKNTHATDQAQITVVFLR